MAVVDYSQKTAAREALNTQYAITIYVIHKYRRLQIAITPTKPSVIKKKKKCNVIIVSRTKFDL